MSPLRILVESESFFPMCSVDFQSLTLSWLVYVNLTQARATGEEGASIKKKASIRLVHRHACRAFSYLVVGGEGTSPLWMRPPLGRWSCVLLEKQTE